MLIMEEIIFQGGTYILREGIIYKGKKKISQK